MKKIFEPQMVMIEDQIDVAKDYIKHLDINEVLTQIAYINDHMMLSNFISENNPNTIYWIDMNLGYGKEREGYKMIEIVRNNNPNALVIIYTAYEETKERCIEMGADHFFLKGSDYESNMRTISMLIRHFWAKNGTTFKLLEYYAKIAHIDIDNEVIKLECYLENEIFYRFYPIDKILEYLKIDLKVDLCLKVKIIEIENSFKIKFEYIEDIPDYKTKEWGNLVKRDLKKSSIWRKK